MIDASIPITRYLDNIGTPFSFDSSAPANGSGGTVSGLSPQAAWWVEQERLLNQPATLPYVMEANPVSYELLIDPVQNGPFTAAYNVGVTALEVPQGINLQAPSSL